MPAKCPAIIVIELKEEYVQLPSEEIKETLKACYEVGFRVIHWTGGEPLLRKDIHEFIGYSKKLGYSYQKLTTNGVLLQERTSQLTDNGLNRVNVSLDALDDAIFETQSGTKLFLKVIAGIKSAITAFDDVTVNVCVTSKNVSELPAFIDFAAQHGSRPRIKFLELVPCQNRYEGNQLNFIEEYISSENILLIIKNAYGEVVSASPPSNARQKCTYYKVVCNNVIFGVNPNASINYACQHNACRDFRLSPEGYFAECSIDLRNMIYLPSMPFEERKKAIENLLVSKQSRTSEEWDCYQHRQNNYGFWRFGGKPSGLIPDSVPTKSASAEKTRIISHG